MIRTLIQDARQDSDAESQRGETPILEAEHRLQNSLTFSIRASSLANPITKHQYVAGLANESDAKHYTNVPPYTPVQFVFAFNAITSNPISLKDCKLDVHPSMNLHTQSTSYVAGPFIAHDHEVHHESDQEIRDWLAELCREEQLKVNWKLEYLLHATKNVSLETAMDTEILEPITMGLGPRPDEQRY
jgi:hypothetical protein